MVTLRRGCHRWRPTCAGPRGIAGTGGFVATTPGGASAGTSRGAGVGATASARRGGPGGATGFASTRGRTVVTPPGPLKGNLAHPAGRVVAKVEWHPGELCPRIGFIVTNLAWPAERTVAFYNHRGTASSTSKREGARSGGPGWRAVPSPPTRFAFSSMPSPTTLPISCEPWRCRRRRSRGR